MLTALHIQNLVTIDDLELEFDSGMTTLTGETGAGKSILIDALGLTLGDKADSSMIRNGCDKAEISASYDISTVPQLLAWLSEKDLGGNGSECLIRRTISAKGRSRAFINDSPVTLGILAEVGAQLVNIHGQHAHQSLTLRTHQRELLDNFGTLQALSRDVYESWQNWRNTGNRLSNLRAEEHDRAARSDLLRFQIEELQALQLGENEWQDLGEEHHRLSHSDTLRERCELIVASLYEESGAEVQLQRSVTVLEELLSLDASLKETVELIRTALIEVQEASPVLRHYLETIEIDPGRLSDIDQRLSTIHNTARKYRVEPQQLNAHFYQLTDELDLLTSADARLEQLEEQLNQEQGNWNKLAKRLTKARTVAAKSLSDTVTTQMQQLAMPDGQFVVQLSPVAAEEPTAHGREQIDFLVTANPGHPPQPLSKVASGGELSRISLAIQVATAGLSQIPTLIFDEVDVGIGGRVAEIVGRLLREIGNSCQVLCVTHLPQVAAQGHFQQRVDKLRGDNTTRTAVTPLSNDQRVSEVARMLGGVEVTERTLEHAREMLLNAEKKAS